MTLRIGSQAPDFEADTTQGHIRFHDWLGDSWGVGGAGARLDRAGAGADAAGRRYAGR